MRVLTYNDIELVQYIPNRHWYVFTDNIVVHAQLDRLLDIIDNKRLAEPFITGSALVEQAREYEAEHYMEI